MKTLAVAAFDITSTNLSQGEGFIDCGCDTVFYDIKKERVNKNPDEVGEELLETCRTWSPDLVWFAKGHGVATSKIKEMNKYTKTALWYPDFTHNWDEDLIDKIKTCQYVFCSRHSTVKLAKELNKNSYFLHEGFDHRRDRPFNIEQDLDVTFIGAIGGNNCHFTRPKYLREVGFSVISGAYAEAHAQIVSRSKINLSFCEGDGVSDRFYKILAAGGFCAAEPWDRMEEDFVPGLDCIIFTTTQELKDIIEYYLEHENERKLIAKRGLDTVQKFSRINYAKFIIDTIKNE